MPPSGIVTRKSSDTFAVQDRNTADALHFIAAHATEPITVSDILTAVPMSRRSLERQFAEELGRTPREQILRTHVECAKRLLENTGLKLSTVAARSGFTPSQMFSRLFRQIEGGASRRIPAAVPGAGNDLTAKASIQHRTLNIERRTTTADRALPVGRSMFAFPLSPQ